MFLIIDNYDSFTYNLYQSIAALKVKTLVVRNNRISIDDIIAMNPSGIILSPGPGRPEQAGICVELIKNFGSRIPILGVCLGLQAIALALGCHIIQSPSIVHGKPDLIFHHRKGLYHNLPLPFEAGRYHSLMVDQTTLSKELIIEAENTSGAIMGIRHVKFPVYGVQFHPESILTPHGEKLIQNFVGECA